MTYSAHRFQPRMILQAVWLYVRFMGGYVNRIRPKAAADLPTHRAKPHAVWYLDQVYLSIAGRLACLRHAAMLAAWRAILPAGDEPTSVAYALQVLAARAFCQSGHPIRDRAPRSAVIAMLSMAILLGLSGCVLAPEGTVEEQVKLDTNSPPFEPPVEARQLPPLPAPAGWRDVLRRAFLANGELESAYFEWKAALARIDRAATWPNSNATVSFSYMFSPENIKAWNRTTISSGFDPSVPLSLPVKTETAGRVALETAREAGEKFRAVKFDIQRRVLLAYLDLALAEEKVRIQRDNLNLLKLVADSAAARSQAGGPLQDLLKALTDKQLAKNELYNMEAEAKSVRGTLNGMLGRDPGAALALSPALPPLRPVTADDARLIAVAVDQNPELAGLARQVAGRKDAVELARLAFLPDFVPSGSLTGNVSQVLGMMVMLPTTVPAIRAMISDAESMTRSSEAILRQMEHDRAASFVANLIIMRNAERQTELYRRQVVPSVQQLINSSRQDYAAGTVGFVDLIDSARTYIGVRLMVAQARIEREKRLAELEALAGVDIETLSQPAAQQAALPVQ
jgi:cobalt-zinc-cadmium efflux system outer membrane protein